MLRRYILASGCLPNEESSVQSATLDDLQQVIVKALRILDDDRTAEHQDLLNELTTAFTVTKTPPRDLESDLYRVLAWDYGPLLWHIWNTNRIRSRHSSLPGNGARITDGEKPDDDKTATSGGVEPEVGKGTEADSEDVEHDDTGVNDSEEYNQEAIAR